MTSNSMARRNGTKPGPAELKAEISQTREELGETAAALAAKADVKARVQDKAADLRDRVKDSDPVQAVTRRPVPVAIIAAVTSAAVVALVLIRRSRR